MCELKVSTLIISDEQDMTVEANIWEHVYLLKRNAVTEFWRVML